MEYLRLLDAAGTRTRLRLILETLCGTGIRVSELRFFTVEDVQRGEIAVRCKSKTRTILIPGKLRGLLLAYAKKSGIHSGAIFITRSGQPLNRSNIWAQMKALCEKAQVKASKVFPHNLRKLFARTLLCCSEGIRIFCYSQKCVKITRLFSFPEKVGIEGLLVFMQLNQMSSLQDICLYRGLNVTGNCGRIDETVIQNCGWSTT